GTQEPRSRAGRGSAYRGSAVARGNPCARVNGASAAVHNASQLTFRRRGRGLGCLVRILRAPSMISGGEDPMLELSDIKSSPEELQDYYAQLREQNVTPAWIGGGISIEPQSKAVPHLWRWRDLRPQAMRAAELVGTQQAERRVLRLTNPELQGASASNTLVANIQIVMPGEIARAHRHSAGALRLIIEGRGGYTVVNSERVPMYPGDLVLTPNWSWHDHANDTDAPMIWLDGLDTPLVRMLEAEIGRASW